MAKRRRVTEFDSGKLKCKGCLDLDSSNIEEDWCDEFSATCERNAKGRPLRLPTCLAAERDAAPLVDAETLSTWEKLARTGVGYHCANALALACKILRRQNEPTAVGVFVEAPTPERIPVVLFGEGKVRP